MWFSCCGLHDTLGPNIEFCSLSERTLVAAGRVFARELKNTWLALFCSFSYSASDLEYHTRPHTSIPCCRFDPSFSSILPTNSDEAEGPLSFFRSPPTFSRITYTCCCRLVAFPAHTDCTRDGARVVHRCCGCPYGYVSS